MTASSLRILAVLPVAALLLAGCDHIGRVGMPGASGPSGMDEIPMSVDGAPIAPGNQGTIVPFGDPIEMAWPSPNHGANIDGSVHPQRNIPAWPGHTEANIYPCEAPNGCPSY